MTNRPCFTLGRGGGALNHFCNCFGGWVLQRLESVIEEEEKSTLTRTPFSAKHLSPTPQAFSEALFSRLHVLCYFMTLSLESLSLMIALNSKLQIVNDLAS